MTSSRAVLAGRQTAGAWRGRVHSRFANAVNVAARGDLYALLPDPLWISERNIIVERKVLAAASACAELASDGRALYGDGERLATLEGAPVWSMPGLTGLGHFRLQRLAPRLESPQDAFAGRLRALFPQTVAAFFREEPCDFSLLIGAGPGLTPAGDDMLTGLALALCAERPALLPRLAGECLPLLRATTDISRHQLRDAFKGKFAAPLVNVLLALGGNGGDGGDGTDRELDAALDVAAGIGHSSGLDGLFGLYHGLRVAAGEDASTAPDALPET